MRQQGLLAQQRPSTADRVGERIVDPFFRVDPITSYVDKLGWFGQLMLAYFAVIATVYYTLGVLHHLNVGSPWIDWGATFLATFVGVVAYALKREREHDDSK